MPTIFIVDDDEAIRESLDLLLTHEGYRVVLAEGGLHALEVLRQSAGSAVVLFDFLMPKGDGLDLLRSVTGDETLMRGHAYICMAARRRSLLPDEFQVLMDQLNIPFVAKPFDVSDLLDIVSDSYQHLVGTPHTPDKDMPPRV